MEHQDPAARLARWRASRELSQADLAKELGVSQTLVSDIERGAVRVAKIATAKKIQDLTASWVEGTIRIEDWVDQDTSS